MYIFTFAFYSSLFKDCRLAIESSVFLTFLTRERLFNFSTFFDVAMAKCKHYYSMLIELKATLPNGAKRLQQKLNVRPSPFFFVYRRMRLLILGRSVGLKKKSLKKKNHKHSRNRRPRTPAS